MIKLPKEIKKWGFLHKQVERKGKYAIYEKILLKPEQNPEKPVSVGFEVIKIMNQPEGERFGKFYPAKEAYPSSETWGTYGWTYIELNGAYNKLKELIE